MKSRIRQKSFTRFAPSIYFGGGSSSLIFVVFASLILVFGLIKPQALSGLRVTVTDIVTPAISFIATPFQNMADAIGGVSGVAELRAENAQLKIENIRLKEWYQTALMLQAENQSLQELLNLKVNPSYKYVTARVVSDAGNSFVKTVLISAGEKNNVQKNRAVLAGEGMIGRIIEFGQKTSRVLLITDINSRIPILIENSQQKAIVSGTNGNFLTLKHLPKDSSLIEGARIITSGDGGVFPAGLPLGRVVKTKGGFAVKPYADINKITYVRIIDAPSTNNLIRNNPDALQ